jgi:hypothetical protein
MTEHEFLRALVGAFATAGGPDAAQFDLAMRGAAAQAGHENFWTPVIDEAEHHGVAPLIGSALAAWSKALPRDQASFLPDSVAPTFAVLAARHRRAAAEREHSVDELVTAFAAAGVRLVLLKGAALGHLIYAGPSLRPAVDIDVLVAASDIARAAALARAHGFAFAERHVSRFASRMHHLPSAERSRNGFKVSLEIHTDAMAPDDGGSLTLSSLSEPLRPFARGDAPQGLAFGHIDMLRHLVRHALEPARRLKLIHLLDIVRYRAVFRDQIDGSRLKREFPGLAVALDMIGLVFLPPEAMRSGRDGIPAGVGLGMTPLSELMAARAGMAATLQALFDPPPWWLHAYYGVAADKSLWRCRMVHHPAKLTRWIARRLLAVAAPTMAADGK